MSDTAITAAPPVEAAAPQTSAQPTAAPIQPPAAAQPQPIGITSDQLKQRLEEERRKAEERTRQKVVEDLGIPIDEARALVAKAKELEAEKLSELQRKDAEVAALKPRADRAAVLEAEVKRRADAALSTLTDEQREAVQSLAGTDPVAQLRAVDALRAFVPKPVPAAATDAATQKPPPAPLPAPATTAPPAAAPSPTQPNASPVSHLAEYERRQATNPVEAAHYLLKHQPAIAAEQKARGA